MTQFWPILRFSELLTIDSAIPRLDTNFYRRARTGDVSSEALDQEQKTDPEHSRALRTEAPLTARKSLLRGVPVHDGLIFTKN